MNEQDEKFFETDPEVLELRRSKRIEKLFEQVANKEFPNELWNFSLAIFIWGSNEGYLSLIKSKEQLCPTSNPQA